MASLNITKHIPNFFTLMNIACGFVAVAFAFQSDFLLALYFIVAASFFDFVDGGVARLLHAQSEVGKQLDSLCDVVSFGVAPGVVLFSMMRHALNVSIPLDFAAMSVKDILLLTSMILVPAFSALRLAKFNVDTRQTSSFIGLPVPANALLIASLGALLFLSPAYWLKELLINPYVLLSIAVIQSYLLVSPLPMFALKFKNLKWKDNYLQFVFLALVLALLIFTGLAGIALSIYLYILISLIVYLIGR